MVRNVHFLHIGKTGGNMFRSLAEQVNETQASIQIKCYDHQVSLEDLPNDEDYTFSIRHPVSRFRSGFYSRKRKGLPTTYREWTDAERQSFEKFEHANELAEALYAPEGRGRDAKLAMLSISHTSVGQHNWLRRVGFLLESRPPIAIIKQETFESDVRQLFKLLGVEFSGSFPTDPKLRHANDYSQTPDLSEKAIQNLMKWYEQEIQYYELFDYYRERYMARLERA